MSTYFTLSHFLTGWDIDNIDWPQYLNSRDILKLHMLMRVNIIIFKYQQ